WEKLHAAITIKMQEARAPARVLYHRALRACAPFAHKPARARTLKERLVYGFWYVLILRALLNFIGLRRASVALTGAAPISPEVIRYFRTIGVPLIEVYGLTESTGMILGQSLDDIRWGSVGTATTGVECRLADNGELLVGGEAVFAGYYKNPTETAEVLKDGWLLTGDVVRKSSGARCIGDGLWQLLIAAGGNNLTPGERGNAVTPCPYVKECLVVANRRKLGSARIQIDLGRVSSWAGLQRSDY